VGGIVVDNAVFPLSISSSVFCRAERREYCEWQTFNASCVNEDQVLMIDVARYGRMRIGDCITSNYGHIGCATDVTSDLQRTCSGQRRCVISVISLHDKRSCPKDFKSYLEVEFHCLTGKVALTLTIHGSLIALLQLYA